MNLSLAQAQSDRTSAVEYIYRFGRFEFDTRAGELRRNGLRVRMQDQPRLVLVALLEHAGDPVDREELVRRLWPADTFVDFDIGLNTAVRKLRHALSDRVNNPRFIETLSRRGYRFISPVAVFEVDPARQPSQLFPAGMWHAALSGRNPSNPSA